MPLPSVGRTWTRGYNVAAAQGTIAAQGRAVTLLMLQEMLAAGGTCAGSSNGGKATVNSVGSGTNFVIANVSGATWSLTDNSGNNLFTADMVGSNLVLASFTNGGNNHTFVITAFISSSVIRFAQGSFTPVAETGPGAATWSMQAAAGMDGVDRITSGVANLNWDSGGNAHSWMVVSWPNGKRMLVSCSTGAGNYHLLTFDRGTAAFTGGSTTADPTAPTNHGAHASRQYLRSAYAASHVHWQYSDAHDFIFAVSPDSSGWPAFVLMELNLANAPSGTVHPYVGFDNWGDSGRGALIASAMAASASVVMFRNDDTRDTSMGAIDPLLGGARMMAAFTNTQNYELVAVPWGCNTSAHAQFNGTAVDVYWCSNGSGCQVGDETPATGAQVFQSWGDMMIANGDTTAVFT